jgi:antitoxin YefM
LTADPGFCTVFLYGSFHHVDGSSHQMSIETTYTQARAGFARLIDRVAQDRETVIIRRRNREPVALIAADELRSLEETARLLRSPKNAERLLAALGRARSGAEDPQTVDDLRRELGVGDES